MHVLGVRAHQGLAAAALLRDGRALAAAAEERFSRRPRDSRIPSRGVAYCLRKAGIDAADLDVVVFDGTPLAELVRDLEVHLVAAPRAPLVFLREARVRVHDTLRVSRARSRMLGGYRGPLLFSERAESLAAAAFYPSPFARAAILVSDGGGGGTTTSLARGDGRRIEMLREIRFPHG
ncbi:MAG: hypothetical protein L0323_19225, partial [Planctomycetes bacterium]|nr:hypothetical protein [Planctomycetota bacterium]